MSKGFEMEWKGSYRCRLIPLLRKGSTSESRCHEMSARLRELMPRATDLVFLRRRGGFSRISQVDVGVLHRSKRKSVVHDEAAKRDGFRRSGRGAGWWRLPLLG